MREIGASTRVLAVGEDSHALRLTSELVDLRAANANLIPLRLRLAEQGAKRRRSEKKRNTTQQGGVSFCQDATKKIFLSFLNKVLNSHGIMVWKINKTICLSFTQMNFELDRKNSN